MYFKICLMEGGAHEGTSGQGPAKVIILPCWQRAHSGHVLQVGLPGGVPRSLLEFLGRKASKFMKGQPWAAVGRRVILPTHLGRVCLRAEPGQEKRARFWQHHRCRWASSHCRAGLSSSLSQRLCNFAGASLCRIPTIHNHTSSGRRSPGRNAFP